MSVMKKDYTHVTYVVDRSGSMSSVWGDTIGGLSEFVKTQKAEKGKCTFSLYAFDGEIETPVNFLDIGVVSEKVEDYGINPRGLTALRDAIGRAITETGSKLGSLTESERPDKVLVIIQTDGLENNSKEYTAAQIKSLIDEQKTKYNWQFMFLGADENSVASATRDYGFSADTTAYYDKKNTKSYHSMVNSKVSALRCAIDIGAAEAALSYSSLERSALAD